MNTKTSWERWLENDSDITTSANTHRRWLGPFEAGGSNDDDNDEDDKDERETRKKTM